MSPAVLALMSVTRDGIVMSGRARAMTSAMTPGATQMTGTMMYPSTRAVKALRARSRRASVAARVAVIFVEDTE